MIWPHITCSENNLSKKKCEDILNNVFDHTMKTSGVQNTTETQWHSLYVGH